MSTSTICELHNGKMDNSKTLHSHLKEKYHSAYHFLVPTLCASPAAMGFSSLMIQSIALCKPKLCRPKPFRYSLVISGLGLALLVAATSVKLFSKSRKDDASEGKSCKICTFINPKIKEQYEDTNNFCTKALILDFFALLGAVSFQYSTKSNLKTFNISIFKLLGAAAVICAAYQAFSVGKTALALDSKLDESKITIERFSQNQFE